jgi:integrase
MLKLKLQSLPSVSFWLKKAAHSPRTARTYLYYFDKFIELTGLDPEAVVFEWQKVRYDYAERERFLDKHSDLIERFYVKELSGLTPKSKTTNLAAILSFYRHNKIPLEVDIQEKIYIVNHNRAILKEEILRILDHATLRDKSFFLIMLESGLRPQTIVMLRYKHIKTDFEQGKIPMMIRLDDSEMLKDFVSARFTFLGQYGFDTLKEYLSSGSLDKKGQVTSRLPMKDDDVLFLGVHTKQQKEACLSPNLFSLQFAKIVQKLGLSQKKEGRFRRELCLYTLRKYFRNNIKTSDPAYREFWMGHKLDGVDRHYFDAWMEDPNIVEKHRAEYAKAYKLYGLQQNFLQNAEVNEDLKKKDQEIAALKESMKKLQPLLEVLEKTDPENLKLFISTWLETEDANKAFEAKTQGKPFTRSVKLELTEDQAAKVGAITDDMNIKLAETLQKAFNIALEELSMKNSKRKPKT